MAVPAAAEPGVGSALYNRVWRWHFYAGLVCLPFLVLLATTGGLYLFKEPIESWWYARLFEVEPARSPPRGAETLVARARAVVPGEPVRYVPPAGPGRSVEVGVRTADGIVAVFLDPADGRVLGQLRDDDRLMEVVRNLHSLAIAGPVANHWIEIVAGWAIVLVCSGVFLWWPRGRGAGVWTVRSRPSKRLWWRDLHAVTGIVAAAAVLFLAVTGMPWSAFWGAQFGRITSAWDVGVPAAVWGPPPEAPTAPPGLAGLTSVPWGIAQVAPPESGHAHGAGGAAAAAAPGAPAPAAGSATSDIGLDRALRLFADLGVPGGSPIRLPDGPRGVYTAMVFPGDVRDVRVVHLDRGSGSVRADIDFMDYGAVGQAVEMGIAIHTGRQFGLANQLLMLGACIAIVLLAVSGAVMWWKRRPAGTLAAPPRLAGDQAAAGAIVVAVVLGVVYPLLGASMLVVLALDAVVRATRRGRTGHAARR